MSVPTVSLGKLSGVNNLLPQEKLRQTEGSEVVDFVQSAVNGNFTDAGTFRRRAGATQVLSGTDCHSFWVDGKVAYLVDDDKLVRVVDTAGTLQKSDVANVTPGLQMSYSKPVSDVYASNGVQRFRITQDGVALEWGIKPPATSPLLTAVSNGYLQPGRYQVVISYQSADGEESGTTVPQVIELSSVGGIGLSGLPTLAGFSTLVYCTDCNGDVFYKVAALTSGATHSILSTSDQGARPIGLLMAPMPAGSIVRHLNGRLFVASGNMLFYSEPYNFGLYNPARNYIPFPEPITMCEPCQNGIYLSSDQTYWIDGEISEADLNPVLPYKAVAGTATPVPNQNAVWWMSERGIVLGSQDGQVSNLQEKHVAVTPGVVGASLFREQDGMKQMISTTFGPQSTVMAASSFMEAEIVRKETQL